MLHSIAVILFFAICVMAFISPKWAICLFIAHKILIPVSFITIGSFVFPSNYLALLIFVGYIIRHSRNYEHFCFNPVKYYGIYFLFCVITAAFSWDYSLCFGYVKSDALSLLLIPFVLLNIAKFDKTSWNFINVFCFAVIAVAIVYGLFLIPLKGLNPYTIELKSLVGGNMFSEQWLMEEGRIFGRITGTFTHPMYYANFLLYALLFLFYMNGKIKACYLNRALIVAAMICLLTCGVRSAVMALGIVFVVYCIYEKKTRVLKYVVLFLVAISLIAVFFPSFYEYLISPLVADSVSSTNGSSFAMRLSQLTRLWDVIAGKSWFGYGYGWTTWYMQKDGNHPTLLAFESLIVKVVCEGGLIGSAIFIWLYYKLYNLKINSNRTRLFCKLMIVAFIGFTIFTGDYLYSSYFLIFFSLVYGNHIAMVYSQKKDENMLDGEQ